jgi:DNA ligase-1
MWKSEDCIIDGELLLPHMPPLQETSRAAKKFRKGISDTLEYHVYDIVDNKNPFTIRYAKLQRLSKKFPKNVKLVPTEVVNDEQELFEAHSKFVSKGYEGTIVRNFDGLYEIGHRSNSLLKLKDFQDAEFRIVDVEEGKGSFKGKAIFVCENKDGTRFNCTPEGSMEYREELYRTRKNHIGKWLTVRFQALTEDNVPQFPIGVDIREDGEF